MPLDTLNADAPALFLFAPISRAAATRRLGAVALNPYSWLADLPTWQLSEKSR